MGSPFSGWMSVAEASDSSMPASTSNGCHSAWTAAAPARAASGVSATTSARRSASHRDTSQGTGLRPVCSTPMNTGWSAIVSPNSLTCTSADPSTATTPGTARAAERSRLTSRAWGWSVNTATAHSASAGIRSLG